MGTDSCENEADVSDPSDRSFVDVPDPVSRWPGYLDNTVAGGIPAGMAPFDCLVKESMEEAGLSEDVVRNHARSVGCVSYFFQ